MTTTLERTTEVTQGYYNELISFLKASKEAAENQKAEFSPAEQLLRQTEGLYEKAIGTIGTLSKTRFGEAGIGTKIYDGLAGATANVTSFFSGLGKHDDSKTLRDTYTNLVAASCGLQMLYATDVSGFGKSRDSGTLLSLLTEMNGLIMEYGHVIPHSVLNELSEEDAAFTTSQHQEIISDLQGTWK